MKFYDDDMDELFNKAGRDYPLKTEPKNWDAVRSALLQENGAAGVTQKSNGWRRLLPLLFLLLIPTVYLFVDKDNINRDISNSKQSVKEDGPAVTNTEIANTNNNNTVINKNSDREVSRKSYVPPSKHTLREVMEDKASVNVKKGGLSGPPQAGKEIERGRDSEILLAEEPAFWNTLPSLNTGFSSRNEPSEVISLNTSVRSLNQSSGLTSVPKSEKNTKNNKKGFYYGLIAGPDLSTIKGQNVKGLGYSAGAVVGYTFNNRWEVEGGIMWSRKKYYTDGKYFDKEAAGVASNINVRWLDGGCEMFEFPVFARYNFSKKNNTFFGSAGLTSYMMKKEDYDYMAQVGTNGYSYKGYKEYDRSGDHLFANLQLSAGYKFSLSSKLNIRIEPYLKTPLKKIGIGKMPITSAGLYFAITRDFR